MKKKADAGKPDPSPKDGSGYDPRKAPIKVDKRVVDLLNALAYWTNDLQYRTLYRIVIDAVREKGVGLPEHLREALESLEAELQLPPPKPGGRGSWVRDT